MENEELRFDFQFNLKTQKYEVTLEQLENVKDIFSKYYDLKDKYNKSQKEILELVHIIGNKVIADYDIDTPLKIELIEEKRNSFLIQRALHMERNENKKLQSKLNEISKKIDNLNEYYNKCVITDGVHNIAINDQLKDLMKDFKEIIDKELDYE